MSLQSLRNAPFEIAGRKFSSRLILGTGKFSSNEAMRSALGASGAGDRHRRPAPGRSVRKKGSLRQYSRVHRPRALPASAQHQRSHERRGSGAPGTPGRSRRPAQSGSSSRFIPTRAICFPTRSKLSKPPRSWSRKVSPSCPTSTPIRCWPSGCRMPAPPPSCPSARRLAAIAASRPASRSRSSSSRPPCRWSSMPASVRPVRPPKPWKWAPTPCSSTLPSPSLRSQPNGARVRNGC